VPVGVTGHRTQRPRGQVGPPGPHPSQPSSASLDPGGEAASRSLAPLIAQLVHCLLAAAAAAAAACLLHAHYLLCAATVHRLHSRPAPASPSG
jgi:hypothetical protein